MSLDAATCYRALRTRDARFDGRFYTGVRTTGVYCRPVCPARTPRRENCRFFPCAAAAQAAGFRPCRRCRPETAPGTPAWLGTSATVSRALRLISRGALDAASVADLALRCGVGERHLRRLFLQHLGATPIAVAQVQRVFFAKKLVDETAMPLVQVAEAAGFGSVRRFNAAMQGAFRQSPRAMRRRPRRDVARSPGLALELPYRSPFDWERLLQFLAHRALAGVESVRDGVYRRTLSVGGACGRLEVRDEPSARHLAAHLWLSDTQPILECVVRLRGLFDLGSDPASVGAVLRQDPRLAPLWRARQGLRVPGAWDGFELAVRAILGQRVSVAAARTLAARLVHAWGERLPGDAVSEEAADLVFLFPRPEALAHADLTPLGVTSERSRAIAALATAVAGGTLTLDGTQDPAATREALCRIPGIGPWTADYIAMRALGDPDAFPAADLVLRRGIARLLRRRSVGGAEAERVAEAWRPWRAYAALHLWNEEAERGTVVG